MVSSRVMRTYVLASASDERLSAAQSIWASFGPALMLQASLCASCIKASGIGGGVRVG